MGLSYVIPFLMGWLPPIARGINLFRDVLSDVVGGDVVVFGVKVFDLPCRVHHHGLVSPVCVLPHDLHRFFHGIRWHAVHQLTLQVSLHGDVKVPLVRV